MPANNKAVKSPWAKQSRPRDSWEGDTRCLYLPRIREGFFSDTGFPTNGLLGNPFAYARIPIRCRDEGKGAYSSSFLVGSFSETHGIKLEALDPGPRVYEGGCWANPPPYRGVW